MQPHSYLPAKPKIQRKRQPIWLWVILAVTLLACGGGFLTFAGALRSDTKTVDQAPRTTTDEGDRKRDVTINACNRTIVDTVEVSYTIKNSSAESQSYTPHFQFVGTGDAVVGEAYDFANEIKSGQTFKGKAIGTVNASGPFKCNLLDA